MPNQPNTLPETYYNRGVAYAQQGDFESAIADFRKAIERNPMFVAAHYNLGLVYATLGNAAGERDYFEKAIHSFNEAIRLKPNFAEAYNNLGFTYYNLGVIYDQRVNIFEGENYFEKAIHSFNEAIRLRANDPKVYFNRSLIWLQLGDWERAKSDLTLARDQGFDIVHAFFISCGNNRVNVEKACVEFNIPSYIVAMLTGRNVEGIAGTDPGAE